MIIYKEIQSLCTTFWLHTTYVTYIMAWRVLPHLLLSITLLTHLYIMPWSLFTTETPRMALLTGLGRAIRRPSGRWRHPRSGSFLINTGTPNHGYGFGNAWIEVSFRVWYMGRYARFSLSVASFLYFKEPQKYSCGGCSMIEVMERRWYRSRGIRVVSWGAGAR